MAETVSPEAVFEAWKKQMEESTQAWARAVAGGGHAADPLQMWRPFMEQAAQGFHFHAMGPQQGVAGADFAAQWKALLDQWLNAWDQVLTKAVGSEQFAQALSAHVDQWLSAQAPLRKATKDSRDAALEAFGVASKEQVVGIARQIMDLDDRLEDLERGLKAVLTKLDAVRPEQADAARPGQTAAPKSAGGTSGKGHAVSPGQTAAPKPAGVASGKGHTQKRRGARDRTNA